MNKMLLGSMGVSGVAPLLLGASGVPVPVGAPDWLPWFLAVCGPLIAWFGTLGLRLAAAMMRAKAKKLRSDKDKSNDSIADALEAGAEVLDKDADKKGNGV
jgi:hypothetical protein